MAFSTSLTSEAFGGPLGGLLGGLGGAFWLKSRLKSGQDAIRTLLDNFFRPHGASRTTFFLPWSPLGAPLGPTSVGLGPLLDPSWPPAGRNPRQMAPKELKHAGFLSLFLTSPKEYALATSNARASRSRPLLWFHDSSFTPMAAYLL